MNYTVLAFVIGFIIGLIIITIILTLMFRNKGKNVRRRMNKRDKTEFKQKKKEERKGIRIMDRAYTMTDMYQEVENLDNDYVVDSRTKQNKAYNYAAHIDEED